MCGWLQKDLQKDLEIGWLSGVDAFQEDFLTADTTKPLLTFDGLFQIHVS